MEPPPEPRCWGILRAGLFTFPSPSVSTHVARLPGGAALSILLGRKVPLGGGRVLEAVAPGAACSLSAYPPLASIVTLDELHKPAVWLQLLLL